MLAAKAVSQFKKDGYFVIPGVIDEVLNRRLGAFVGGLAGGGAGSRSLLDEAWCDILRLAGPFIRPCIRPAPANQRRDFDSPYGIASVASSLPQ